MTHSIAERKIAWVYLTLAILTEVSGTTSMKLSNGFSLLLPSIFIFIFYGISFIFLALSLKRIEVGIAYALWSALGILLIFLIGVIFFNEQITILKALSALLIIVGTTGLKQA